MGITKKDVNYVAKLARLKLTDEEMEKYTSQLENILKYIEKLKELDTSKIEPTSHVIEMSNVFREDRVEPSYPVEEITANAPKKEKNFYKVKKVIE